MLQTAAVHNYSPRDLAPGNCFEIWTTSSHQSVHSMSIWNRTCHDNLSTSQTLHFIGIYMGRMTVIVCIQCLTTSCYHLIESLKTFLTGMALVKTTLSCLAILSAENSSLPTQTKQLTLRAGLDDEINLVHKVSQWLTFAKYGNHVWTIFDLSKKLIVSHPKTKVAIGCSTCYTRLHHY